MILLGLLGVMLCGAVVVLCVPDRMAKPIAATIAILGLVGYLAMWFTGSSTVNWPWIPELGISFHLGLDGLSIFLVGLTAVLVPMAILAARAERGRTYFFWMLFTEFAAIGLFSALDLALFYVFFEAVLLPVFFFLTGWGGPKGRPAAMKFLVMNLVGSFFMLAGIVGLVAWNASASGAVTFDVPLLLQHPVTAGIGSWFMLASFLLAFGIKAPLWPLHGWMPDAYGESDAPVTAILSGLLSKAGIYGLLRIVVPEFAPMLHVIQGWLIAGALVGLVWGAMVALRQTDMKRIAGYASLSHMGMMALGVFSLTAPGILGATYQMVAHGLMVGGLFIVLGLVEERTGSRDISVLSGMGAGTPRLAAYFLLFTLALLGLPGLPGFAGELMVIQGLVVRNLPAALVAIAVLVVAAWYMLRLFQTVMQGPPTRSESSGRDLGAGRVAIIATVAALVIGLGVWPAGITSVSATSVFQAVHLSALQGGWNG